MPTNVDRGVRFAHKPICVQTNLSAVRAVTIRTAANCAAPMRQYEGERVESATKRIAEYDMASSYKCDLLHW